MPLYLLPCVNGIIIADNFTEKIFDKAHPITILVRQPNEVRPYKMIVVTSPNVIVIDLRKIAKPQGVLIIEEESKVTLLGTVR